MWVLSWVPVVQTGVEVPENHDCSVPWSLVYDALQVVVECLFGFVCIVCGVGRIP